MKNIFLITFLFLFATSLYAEPTIAYYNCDYFGEQYEIQASKQKNGKFSVFIQIVSGEGNQKMFISIKNEDLEELRTFLSAIKDKYNEWSTIATNNNVTDLVKVMNIKSPSVNICWLGSQWFFSFYQKLTPTFKITSKGEHIVYMSKKVTSSSNKYIDATYYWDFSNTKDIDELIEKLDENKIIQFFEKENQTESLFN